MTQETDMRKDFTKLEVWKKAHILVLEIYKLAKKLPDTDQEYGVAFDVCQTALAVPATIARSCAFDDEGEFRECLEEARMGLRHVDMQLMVMRDLGHITAKDCDRLMELVEEVRGLLIKQITKRKPKS